MATKEHNLSAKYQRSLTKWQRLWRCNSGSAWAGKFLSATQAFKLYRLRISMLIFPKKIQLWPPGTPDYIGFDSVIITPDMVGKRVAVFVGTEVKTDDQKLNTDQGNFKKLIVDMGGIHREVRDDTTVESKTF